MTIRVYTPPKTRQKRKQGRRIKPWNLHPKIITPDKKTIDFYRSKFTDLSPKLIEATLHSNGKWVLDMMLRNFDDTTKVGDRFYTWASNLMRIIGGDRIQSALYKKIPLYEFLQDEQERLKDVQKPDNKWVYIELKKRKMMLRDKFKKMKNRKKRPVQTRRRVHG